MHRPSQPERDEESSTFVIADGPSLERFRRHVESTRLRGAYRRIHVALPFVEHRDRLERRLNFNYRACGCFEGGIAALLVLLALLGWHLSDAASRMVGWSDLAAGCGWVLLAALVGKGLGIVRAHISLHRAVQAMEDALAAEGAAGGLS